MPYLTPEMPVYKPPVVPAKKTVTQPAKNYNAQAIQSLTQPSKLTPIQSLAVGLTKPFTPTLFGQSLGKETTLLKELPGAAGWALGTAVKNIVSPPVGLIPGIGMPEWLTGLLSSPINFLSPLLLETGPRDIANIAPPSMFNMPEHYSPETNRLRDYRRTRFR
jgi:hypothetical protein